MRILQFAKAMRRQPTDAEALVWKYLRAGRLLGFKFKRQQPIGDYIVDFVCLDQRVIVELDGGQHGDEAHVVTDNERTRWLESQGFVVLRFWNHDVLARTENVLDAIVSALRANPSPQPLSRKGRGAKDRLQRGPERRTQGEQT